MSDELDLNEVKAGDYELIALSWDQQTSKRGEPYDYVTRRQGDKVTLDVEQARRLMAAGAVKPFTKTKADKPKPKTEAPTELDITASIDNVVAWVNGGTTPEEVVERAKAALAAEQEAKAAKNENPREGLVSKLTAVIEPTPA